MSAELKERVGAALAEMVQDGMVLGVGTGSTVDAALHKIGERIKAESLKLKALTSSLQSAQLCQKLGIEVLHYSYQSDIKLGFDGADAVDASLRAIKGKGGAMLQEKILATRCSEYVLLVDSSKVVSDLAVAAKVPVEVVPEALSYVKKTISSNFPVKSLELRLSVASYGPVITEAGNLILDVDFSKIDDNLEKELAQIVGVVETGLFLNYADRVLVSDGNSIKTLSK